VAALALAAVTWALSLGWPEPVLATGWALLIGALALMRDRGSLAPAAVPQWAALVMLTQLVWIVAHGGAPGILRLLDLGGEGAGPSWLGLPRLQLAVYAVGLVALAIALIRWRGAVERGLAWALVLVALGLHPAVGGHAPRLFLLAAGLALALTVVETSYTLAYRDELTALPARRALLRDLEGLSGTYTLGMVDVDHFKKFNDRHGHDVGDQVLRLVASRLARAPGGARAYRYGGEEFTLLMAGLDRDEAQPHLEAVRAAVEEASFALRSWRRPRKKPEKPRGGKRARKPRRLSVTVSIGVADSDGGKRPPEEVLGRADKALYRAKRAGRNRLSR
jgi:GGDEF domain-containing protein